MTERSETSPRRRLWGVAMIFSVNILAFMAISLTERDDENAVRHMVVLLGVPFNTVAGFWVMSVLRR